MQKVTTVLNHASKNTVDKIDDHSLFDAIKETIDEFSTVTDTYVNIFNVRGRNRYCILRQAAIDVINNNLSVVEYNSLVVKKSIICELSFIYGLDDKRVKALFPHYFLEKQEEEMQMIMQKTKNVGIQKVDGINEGLLFSTFEVTSNYYSFLTGNDIDTMDQNLYLAVRAGVIPFILENKLEVLDYNSLEVRTIIVQVLDFYVAARSNVSEVTVNNFCDSSCKDCNLVYCNIEQATPKIDEEFKGDIETGYSKKKSKGHDVYFKSKRV